MRFKLELKVVIECIEAGPRKDEWKKRVLYDARQANDIVSDIRVTWENDRAVFTFELPDSAISTGTVRRHWARALAFAGHGSVRIAEYRFVVTPPVPAIKTDSCKVIVPPDHEPSEYILDFAMSSRQIAQGLPVCFNHAPEQKM